MREAPVREYQKKIEKRLEEMHNPDHKPKEKVKQSAHNVMLSSKGTVLDVQRQINQLALNTKQVQKQKIQTSKSTLEERFVLKKQIENADKKMIEEIIPALKFRTAAAGHAARRQDGGRDSEDEEYKHSRVPIKRLTRFERRMGATIKDIDQMDARRHIEAVLISKEQEHMKEDMIAAYKDQRINDKIMAFAEK